MSSSAGPLPLELLLRVMTFLRGDPIGLHQCTLVSRDWKSASQPELLSNIRIYSDIETRSPAALVLFLATRPDLTPFIHHVVVSSVSVALFDRVFNIDKLPSLLAQLPHLKSLSFRRLMLSHPLVSKSPFSQLWKLKYLSLQDVWISHTDPRTGASPSAIAVQTLLALIKLFSSIERLSLSDVRFLVAITPPLHEALQLSTHIRVLDVEPSHAPRNTAQMIQCIVTPDSTHLCLNKGLQFSDPELRRQHQDCIDAATHLKSMELYISSENLPRGNPVLSLGSCHELVKLTLAFTPTPGSDATWEQVVAVPHSLPPTSILSHLRIVIVIPEVPPTEPSSVSSVLWDPIVASFARFDDLRIADIILVPTIQLDLDNLDVKTVPSWHVPPEVVAFFQRSPEQLGFPRDRPYVINVGFSRGTVV